MSRGGRGPFCLGLSSLRGLESRSELMYPGCRYFLSPSMRRQLLLTFHFWMIETFCLFKSALQGASYAGPASHLLIEILTVPPQSTKGSPEGICGRAERLGEQFLRSSCSKYICTMDWSGFVHLIYATLFADH